MLASPRHLRFVYGLPGERFWFSFDPGLQRLMTVPHREDPTGETFGESLSATLLGRPVTGVLEILDRGLRVHVTRSEPALLRGLAGWLRHWHTRFPNALRMLDCTVYARDTGQSVHRSWLWTGSRPPGVDSAALQDGLRLAAQLRRTPEGTFRLWLGEQVFVGSAAEPLAQFEARRRRLTSGEGQLCVATDRTEGFTLIVKGDAAGAARRLGAWLGPLLRWCPELVRIARGRVVHVDPNTGDVSARVDIQPHPADAPGPIADLDQLASLAGLLKEARPGDCFPFGFRLDAPGRAALLTLSEGRDGEARLGKDGRFRFQTPNPWPGFVPALASFVRTHLALAPDLARLVDAAHRAPNGSDYLVSRVPGAWDSVRRPQP